jgi:hypothetical protein
VWQPSRHHLGMSFRILSRPPLLEIRGIGESMPVFWGFSHLTASILRRPMLDDKYQWRGRVTDSNIDRTPIRHHVNSLA